MAGSGSRSEDLTIVQGTDALFKINIKQANGAAFDISDKSFSAQLKRSFSSPANSAIDFTTDLSDAANGVFSISLSDTITADLAASTRYVYDVLMYNTSGNTDITSILNGKVIVEPSVTRLS